MANVEGLTLKNRYMRLGVLSRDVIKSELKETFNIIQSPSIIIFYRWETSPECVHINLSHFEK